MIFIGTTTEASPTPSQIATKQRRASWMEVFQKKVEDDSVDEERKSGASSLSDENAGNDRGSGSASGESVGSASFRYTSNSFAVQSIQPPSFISS